MTLREFVSKLTDGGRGEVTLSEGIKLTSAPVYGLMPKVLADALESFLPGDAEIHSGWQIETLGDSESARHRWVLIVGDALVVVRATRRTGQSQGILFDVVVRELPLAAVVPEVQLSYFTDNFRGGASSLIDAKVIFAAAGETFTVEIEDRDNRPAFCHFVGHLRAAIARSRACRTGGDDGSTR